MEVVKKTFRRIGSRANKMEKIILAIKATLAPEPRAIATGRSFEEFFANCGEVSEADFGAACTALSIPKPTDDGPTSGRRKTVGEIAGLCIGGGSAKNAAKNWQAFAVHCQKQAETAPEETRGRYANMAETATREAAELSA